MVKLYFSPKYLILYFDQSGIIRNELISNANYPYRPIRLKYPSPYRIFWILSRGEGWVWWYLRWRGALYPPTVLFDFNFAGKKKPKKYFCQSWQKIKPEKHFMRIIVGYSGKREHTELHIFYKTISLITWNITH